MIRENPIQYKLVVNLTSIYRFEHYFLKTVDTQTCFNDHFELYRFRVNRTVMSSRETALSRDITSIGIFFFFMHDCPTYFLIKRCVWSDLFVTPTFIPFDKPNDHVS